MLNSHVVILQKTDTLIIKCTVKMTPIIVINPWQLNQKRLKQLYTLI